MAIHFPAEGKKGLSAIRHSDCVRNMLESQKEWWMRLYWWHKLLFSLVFAAMTLVIVGFLWIYKGVKDSPEHLDTADPSRAISDRVQASDAGGQDLNLPGLSGLSAEARKIVRNNFAALGGRANLERIQSLRILADMQFTDGTQHGLTIMKKRGSRIRVTFESGAVTVVLASTPEDTWRGNWKNGRLVEVVELSEDERGDLIRSASVVTELMLAREMGWEVSYVGERTVETRTAYAFDVTINPEQSLRIFIDPETYLDLARREQSTLTDGTLREVLTVYREFETLDDGYRVPFKVETFVNGERVNTIHVQSVEINPGILNASFDRPN
jgi:outer membrane lipoprotein-sorting protein